jgi:hypothetical protein
MYKTCEVWEKREMRTKFWSWKLKKKIRLGYLDVNVIIIGICCEDVDWIRPAYNKVPRRGLVNTALNFRIPRKEGNSVKAEQISASEEGLCSMELGIKDWVFLSE